MTIVKIFQGKNGKIDFGIYQTEKDVEEINKYKQKVVNIEIFKKVFKLQQINENDYVKDFKKKEEVEIFANDGSVSNIQEEAKKIKKDLLERQQYEHFHTFGI